VSHCPRWPRQLEGRYGCKELQKFFLISFLRLIYIGKSFHRKNISDSLPRICPTSCLGHLGRHNIKRNNIVCVPLPKLAKVKGGHYCGKESQMFLPKNFANVNTVVENEKKGFFIKARLFMNHCYGTI
jgi:hypothetical protein